MKILDQISPSLLKEEIIDERYINSPFINLKKISAKQLGSRYEKIVIEVMQKLGYNYNPRSSSDNDAIFNNKKYEIKGSMLNKNSNKFSFLQIRPNQDYDKLLFALFYPQKISLLCMSKKNILINIKNDVFKKQHGGLKGNSNTYMYYGEKESLLRIGAKLINEIE